MKRLDAAELGEKSSDQSRLCVRARVCVCVCVSVCACLPTSFPTHFEVFLKSLFNFFMLNVLQFV